MEDKRITKTKRNLKETMVALLHRIPFEKINVTSLCKQAETSRITFYTYYDDKYSLISEIMEDYHREAVEDYRRMQKENNPKNNVLTGYFNMLDCILHLYTNHPNFFEMVSSDRNPYLFSAFYQYVFHNVENYIKEHSSKIRAKYPAAMTATLLCNGLLGVINECYKTKKTIEKMIPAIRNMYKDLLMSNLFITA
ncbi:MAG: TetR/AcrR family transcriptional regulator [Clostridia bacterium]|nr:TetR/AcrR family transcriptional regulator [Clostridia bacterium]